MHVSSPSCLTDASRASQGLGTGVRGHGAVHRTRCEIKDGPSRQGEREYNHPGETGVGNYSSRPFLPRWTASHRGSGSWVCDLGQVVCFWELHLSSVDGQHLPSSPQHICEPLEPCPPGVSAPDSARAERPGPSPGFPPTLQAACTELHVPR